MAAKCCIDTIYTVSQKVYQPTNNNNFNSYCPIDGVLNAQLVSLFNVILSASIFFRFQRSVCVYLQIKNIVYNICSQEAECDMLVGVLQSAGLALVHAHSSRLVSVTDDDNTTVIAAVTSSRLIDSDGRVIQLVDVPFWLFSLHRYLSALSLLSTAYILVNLSLYVVSFSLKFFINF